MIDCAHCGRHRRHEAKGMCPSCYAAARVKARAPRECPACHQLSRTHIKGLCQVCYNAQRRRGAAGLTRRLNILTAPELTRETFAEEWPHMLKLLGEQHAILRLADTYSVSEKAVRQYALDFGRQSEKAVA